MNIGIPNEVSVEERRIALTPVGVYALCNEGHTVYLEKGAGKSCGFADQEFLEVGAQLVFSPEEVFLRSALIVKVEPPIAREIEFLDANKMLFSFLNPGTMRKPIIELLRQKEVSAIGYEFSEQPDGSLPILTAMSEIVGGMLPQIAGRFLESQGAGRGVALQGAPGIPSANVVILGAGAVGFTAARAFSALGAQVLIMDKNIVRLREVDKLLNKQCSTSIVTPLLVERAARFADVLIGAAMDYGKKTPHLVTKELVREMKPGAVCIDVAIDQGGCFETSRPTTLSSPVFVEESVIHYCVPNIAASVARTASHALNNSILPWISRISQHGTEKALQKYTCLQNGAYLCKGKVTSKFIAELHELEHTDIQSIITA